LDPDSETLWIQIWICIGNPDPDPGARKLRNFSGKKQGCGSGSGLDPDSETCVDPDLDPYWESGAGSGSRGKKTKKFQWKKALFSYFLKKILPLKRYNYFLKKNLMNNTSTVYF
jgi:hypothetical protein